MVDPILHIKNALSSEGYSPVLVQAATLVYMQKGAAAAIRFLVDEMGIDQSASEKLVSRINREFVSINRGRLFFRLIVLLLFAFCFFVFQRGAARGIGTLALIILPFLLLQLYGVVRFIMRKPLRYQKTLR